MALKVFDFSNDMDDAIEYLIEFDGNPNEIKKRYNMHFSLENLRDNMNIICNLNNGHFLFKDYSIDEDAIDKLLEYYLGNKYLSLPKECSLWDKILVPEMCKRLDKNLELCRFIKEMTLHLYNQLAANEYNCYDYFSEIDKDESVKKVQIPFNTNIEPFITSNTVLSIVLNNLQEFMKNKPEENYAFIDSYFENEGVYLSTKSPTLNAVVFLYVYKYIFPNPEVK